MTTRVNATDSIGPTSSAVSLTNNTWYTARVVVDDDTGTPALQRLRFWVDTDNDGLFSDETTLIDDTSIDEYWSGGLVGLFRGQENTTVHKFDDFKFGLDTNADLAIDDFLVDDNFDSAAITLTHDDTLDCDSGRQGQDGNVTHDGVFTYTYDAWNRLRKVQLVAAGDTTVVQEATWLPDGRLASKTITSSGSEHLPNDGGNVTRVCSGGMRVSSVNRRLSSSFAGRRPTLPYTAVEDNAATRRCGSTCGARVAWASRRHG